MSLGKRNDPRITVGELDHLRPREALGDRRVDRIGDHDSDLFDRLRATPLTAQRPMLRLVE